ncbi:hypothetical protein [Pseudopedobacter sp.]|uniref:hypothetical protein n=1 Tax=Pseudopedobacter sp. TaxID=1936787 RepID=UPI003340F817
MKKILLFSLLVWLVSPSKSRAQWVESETLKNFNWDYNLSSGSATVSGIGLEKISTPSVEDFLPKPSSGEVKAAISPASASAGASFTLNGVTTPSLTIVHNGANGDAPAQPAPVKFVARNFAASSKVMNAHFKINLNNTVGNTQAIWYIVIGDGSIDEFSGNTLTPSAGANNTTRDQFLYTVLRIRKVVAGNTYVLQARYRSGNSTTWGWHDVVGGSLVSGTEYTIDLFCNNTDQDQSYTFNEEPTPKQLNAAAYHLYINKVQTPNNNLTRNVVYRSTSDIRQYTGNLSGFAIMSRESAQTGGVNDHSASIVLSDLKIVHLTDETTMPVTLTSFTGNATNNGIALNWQTASEQNNSHFILSRRSGNGKDFREIAKITGNGTTSSIHNYSFTDVSPVTGFNYYKLEQVDLDGKINALDKVVAVNYTTSKDDFTVYKLSNNNIKLSITSNKAESSEIIITDISGRAIYKTKRILEEGVNEFELPVSNFKQVISIVRVQTASDTKSVKIIL